MKKIYLIVFLIINIPRVCFGSNYLDYYIVQFAGEIGLLSAGLGRSFTRYEIAGMYGIVPAGVSRASTIETIAIRQTYFLNEKSAIRHYLGLNIFHVIGLDYQTGSYRDVPQNYYATGSTRVLLNLGLNLKTSKKEGFYFEGGITDIWMENYLRNKNVINPFDHVSLAIGYKKEF